MKLLAFVDLHGSKKALRRIESKAKKADVVVCAGDLTVFENGIEEILKRLDKIGKPVLIIHGNHETTDIGKRCRRYKNIHYIHKRIVMLNGFQFIGYGGGGFSQRERQFERFIEKNKGRITGKTVLVTHAPPYNTKLDRIMRQHCGNKSYRKFIAKFKPLLHICGHLHETHGKTDKIGKTHIMNPGAEGKTIEIRDAS